MENRELIAGEELLSNYKNYMYDDKLQPILEEKLLALLKGPLKNKAMF